MQEDYLDNICPLHEADIVALQTAQDPPEYLKRLIQKRAALVRDAWSERERRRRHSGLKTRVEWNLPVYSSSLRRTFFRDESQDEEWRGNCNSATIYSLHYQLQPRDAQNEQPPVKNDNQQ